MDVNNIVKQALTNAWDEEMANSSIERWLTISKQNNWQWPGKSYERLTLLFGASWYFTRFVFFRGDQIKPFFVDKPDLNFSVTTLYESFYQTVADQPMEKQFEILNICKNEFMLTVFLAQLLKTHKQEEIERALTNLAEAVLLCAFHILLGHDSQLKENIAILAMGRMAGNEINFGSDLDLIFLYEEVDAELGNKVINLVRSLIRNMGVLSPAGSLYNMDTRLRPHGSAGALVSSVKSFINYHKAERAIWERQMMTRCRIIVDYGHIAEPQLKSLQPFIYQQFVDDILRSQILDMRKLVIDQLASQKNQYDLKHGQGGIMDIDFLTHYLQLLHGYDDESLHVASTRIALKRLTLTNNLHQDDSSSLLKIYNYLKCVESCLRVFDMTTVSSFPKDPHKLHRVARGMGYRYTSVMQGGKAFLADYGDKVQRVKQIYNAVMNS